MSDEYLKDWELEAVLFIERHHSVTGVPPSDDDIIEYLRITKKFKEINSESIITMKENPLFQKSMLVRGIVINSTGLTQRQMAAASIMLNLADRRSEEKRLRDIGVTTEEFATWMQNSEFSNYMQQRSEVLISNSVHEAHMGLLRGVKQGNTASIKLFYELTGRYNANEESNVNVNLIIGRVIEAIQKHVSDPKTLNDLAVELSRIAIENTSPVANNFIAGESRRKEIS
ncbi:phBC6A51 family helix-turn-helix protein [Streptomyces hebeiensis]